MDPLKLFFEVWAIIATGFAWAFWWLMCRAHKREDGLHKMLDELSELSDEHAEKD